MIQSESFKLIYHEKDPNIHYIPLAPKLRDYMLLKDNDSLFTYIDPINNQIYFSPFKLSDSLLRCEIHVEDYPGVLAEITKFLKDKNINIEKFSDISAGGYGILEMVINLATMNPPPPLINPLQLKEDLENIKCVQKAPFEYIFPGSISSSVKSNYFGESKLLEEDICVKNIFGDRGINIKLEKNQLGLISCYSKIHLIIVNFYPKNKFIEFYYEHKDQPGAIARASCILKDYLTIKGSNHGTSSENNGRWRGFGLLTKKVDLKEIENKLIKIKEDYKPKKGHRLFLKYVSENY